jgi:hypothetical protein
MLQRMIQTAPRQFAACRRAPRTISSGSGASWEASLIELPDRGPGEVAFFPALDLVTGLANLYRRQGNAAKAQHEMQEYKRLQE